MAPLRAQPVKTAPPLKSILKKNGSHGSERPMREPSETLFPASKKDKRRIKHAHLMNKITKSSAAKPRRRRPSKKFVTTLDALADALPDGDEGESAVGSSAAGARPQDQVNVIKRKSLKSRPGAMKRREKLDQSERDRFAKNMAQLSASNSTASSEPADARPRTSAPPSTSERWAALRGFISQTLETKPQLKISNT